MMKLLIVNKKDEDEFVVVSSVGTSDRLLGRRL
jgi:hypothetical protein